MSLASDFVTKYRQACGELVQVRERLRAYARLLPGEAVLLDDSSAFAGENADITKVHIQSVRAVFDTLDKLITEEQELLIVKVAGSSALLRN